MPIRPEERARYPKDWPKISRRIRERDGNACKWCGAPNGVEIKRLDSDSFQWVTVSAFVEWLLFLDARDIATGRTDPALSRAQALALAWSKPVRVVLTTAHLNHTPEDCSDENLAALCQRCHLRHDARHHAETARATRESRSGQGRLFPR